ncbi:hypothetical protein D5S18_09905 [Nocardia panacis]|uniref:PPE domain-containing protein n=1 Tax=Nocardia panacis TaxID=2340916 RepID=A0A3A4KPE6_9NOCA|nr:hypothetical protein D5S18_09905 [Nocardia panacis]
MTTESSSAATDPAYAPEREHFGGYDHREIWDLVREELDPAALGAVAAGWRAAADALAAAFHTFSDSTDREFAHWAGRSATAARAATREFVHTGAEASEASRAIQRLMELNSDAAQTIRTALAPPPEYRPLTDPAAEVAHGGRRRMEYDIAAAAAQADAQDTMTYLYTPTMPATGDRVPRLGSPPATIAPNPDPPHTGPPSGGGGAR